MFEALIHSRIRRTLLAYLMAYPEPRFYLRGLAKELRVSVGPLHKELHHLEQAGLLTSVLEANVRYYTVNQQSPLFEQLRSFAGQPGSKPLIPPDFLHQLTQPVAPTASDPNGQALQRLARVDSFWTLRLMLVGMAMALGLTLWGVPYLVRMEQRLQAFEGVLAEFLSQTTAADKDRPPAASRPLVPTSDNH